MAWKKQGIIFTLQIIMLLFVIFVSTGLGVLLGQQIISNYRGDMLRAQAQAIDHALDMYSKAHVGVNPSTVRFSEDTRRMEYNKTKIYPKDLRELGVVQADYGYIAMAMRLFGVSETVEFDSFRYSTTTDANGIMSYTLGVTLPNGYYYTSPGSNHAFGSGN